MLPELDYKRIILAILLVIISVALMYGMVWLLFLRAPEEATPAPEEATVSSGVLPGLGTGGDIGVVGAGGELPVSGGEEPGAGIGVEEYQPSLVAQGSLTQVESIIDEKIRDVSLEASGLSYLSAEDDKFYHLLSNGDKLALAVESFPFVDKVTWSTDGRKVILEYPDGANIIYDFTKNKKTTLPKGMEDAVFDSSSDNIAYKYLGGKAEDNWLVRSEEHTSELQSH